MDLKTAIETRASVRSYSSDPVSESDLRAMVRLAGRAPSVNNAQPWRYVAIVDRALCDRVAAVVREKLEATLPEPTDAVQRAATDKLFEYVSLIGRAPAVMVVATRSYQGFLDDALVRTGVAAHDAVAMRGHPDTVSLGASLENLMLAAMDLGYSSCWLTAPNLAARELEVLLHIDSPWRFGAMVTIGRDPVLVPQSPKKPVDEIFELRK